MYKVRIEKFKNPGLEVGQEVTKDHNRWVPAPTEVSEYKETGPPIRGRWYGSGGLGRVSATGKAKPFAGKTVFFVEIEILDVDVNRRLL